LTKDWSGKRGGRIIGVIRTMVDRKNKRISKGFEEILSKFKENIHYLITQEINGEKFRIKYDQHQKRGRF